MLIQNPYVGDPITVQVDAPDTVAPGELFLMTIKVKDIDLITPLNPTGVDRSLRVAFRINSMSRYEFDIAPNFDSGKHLVCVIRGIAQEEPGIYVDYIRGYDGVQGFYWDEPADEMNAVKVQA